MTPRILLLQGAAALASLFHQLVDVWIDVFGTPGGPPDRMTLGEGLTLISIAAIFAWWQSPIAAATAGVRGAMLALAILGWLWAAILNGLSGFLVCLVPCGVASPFHDLAHAASLVFGSWAGWAAYRAYRAMPGPTQLAPAATAVVLIVVSLALQGMNAVLPVR
ncbi:MAG: hypothetical protein ACRDGT_01355 [Candidatus Limnocylindria bacterium]